MEQQRTREARLLSERKNGIVFPALWNILAIGCVVSILFIVGWSQYWIAGEANAQACKETISKTEPKKIAVFPDGDKNLGQIIKFHGRLCIALNINRFFGSSDQANPQDKSYVLFMNGQNTGLKAIGYTSPESDGWLWLNWRMETPQSTSQTADPSAVWKSIIGQPDFATGGSAVTIGIGDDTTQTPREIQSPAWLDLYDPVMARLGAGVLILLGVSLFCGNKETGLFRDGNGKSGDPNQPLATYSLAKVQVAIWMLLTIGGFLFIWVTTGRTSGVVTTDIFALMGIQLTTGLAAVYVDQGTPPSPTTGRFLKDILYSDGQSPALQRIQMFGWTLILAVIFIWSVFSKLSFPAFDASLLVLIGFVNGNYLGFKFPENKEGGKVQPQ